MFNVYSQKKKKIGVKPLNTLSFSLSSSSSILVNNGLLVALFFYDSLKEKKEEELFSKKHFK